MLERDSLESATVTCFSLIDGVISLTPVVVVLETIISPTAKAEIDFPDRRPKEDSAASTTATKYDTKEQIDGAQAFSL